MMASVALTATCAAVGAFIGDLTWTFTSIFGIIVLIMPYGFTRDRAAGFTSKILLPLPFVLAAFIVLASVTEGRMGLFRDLWPVSIALQAWALMIYGYAAFIIVDNHCRSTLSRRWMLLFSLVTANAFMALYAFYIFAMMIAAGVPVYDDYTVASDIALNNWNLMAQMTITLFFTVFYGILLRRHLRGIPKKVLTSYHGGA